AWSLAALPLPKDPDYPLGVSLREQRQSRRGGPCSAASLGASRFDRGSKHLPSPFRGRRKCGPALAHLAPDAACLASFLMRTGRLRCPVVNWKSAPTPLAASSLLTLEPVRSSTIWRADSTTVSSNSARADWTEVQILCLAASTFASMSSRAASRRASNSRAPSCLAFCATRAA